MFNIIGSYWLENSMYTAHHTVLSNPKVFGFVLFKSLNIQKVIEANCYVCKQALIVNAIILYTNLASGAYTPFPTFKTTHLANLLLIIPGNEIDELSLRMRLARIHVRLLENQRPANQRLPGYSETTNSETARGMSATLLLDKTPAVVQMEYFN